MDKHTMQRRRLLAGMVAGGALGLAGCGTMGSSAAASLRLSVSTTMSKRSSDV